jgi:hypothetical protein
VSQLGRVVNDAADPCANNRPAADGVSAHQLADLQRARNVGVERPVGVRRCIDAFSGPNGYAPPGLFERARDLQEAVREARMHDEHGMHVGRDGRVVEEDVVGGRSTAMLVRAGRRVVAEGKRERQEVTLRRTVVNTIGTVEVAALAASAAGVVVAAMTVTFC